MKKVLIIEDNVEIRDNIAELLELEGFLVEVAENGHIGLEVASVFEPHVIVCDIMMPLMNGYELLEITKGNRQTSSIPIIFLSARTESKDLKKAMDMGAFGYIQKPFESVDLLDMIKKATGLLVI